MKNEKREMEMQGKSELNVTVADLVSRNIDTAHVFKKYGIDFCCGGGKRISEVCVEKGIDEAKLMEDLAQANRKIDRSKDYQSWSIPHLIMHIENIHHSYVKESLPMLMEYAEKVARVHGHHYTELLEIKELTEDLNHDLTTHLGKEEKILFPMLRRLFLAKANGENLDQHLPISEPIAAMFKEHDQAGSILSKLETLTLGFEPPEGACNTFRAFYAKLSEFEQDLKLHIHLENNILFPKATSLLSKD